MIKKEMWIKELEEELTRIIDEMGNIELNMLNVSNFDDNKQFLDRIKS